MNQNGNELKVEPGGFIIESVTLNGFMRYLKKTQIVFPKGLTVITGKTGAGKTTILDAVTFALYKQTTRTDTSTKIEDLFSSKDGYVTLKFSQDGHRYEVTRGIDGKKKAYLEFTSDVGRISGNISELDDRIKDIVGLDYVGFKNSTFVRQEEMRQLGSETGSERLKIIQRLFRLEIYEKARVSAFEKAKQKEQDVNKIKIKIDEKKQVYSDLPRLEREKAETKEKIQPLKKKIDELELDIDKSKSDLEKLQTKHDEYNVLKYEFTKTRQSADDLTGKVRHLEIELRKTKDMKARINDLEPQIEGYEKLLIERDKINGSLNTLRTKKSESDIFKEKIHSIDRLIEELENRYSEEKKKRESKIAEYEKRLSSLRTTIDADEAFAFLRHEGALGERIARIEKEVEWLANDMDFVKSLKKEKDDTAKDLKDIEKKVSLINEDSFNIKNIRNDLSEIKNDEDSATKRFDARLEKLNKDKHKIQEQASHLEINDKIDKEITENERRFNEITRKMDHLKKMKTEFDRLKDDYYKTGDLSGQLQDSKEELEKIEKKKNEEIEKVRKLEVIEKEYKDAVEKTDSLTKSYQELKLQSVRLDERIHNLENDITRMELVGDEIKKLEEDHQRVLSEYEVYDILSKNIFHPTGVVMHAISRLLPHLERRSSMYLTSLTDGRLSKINLESYLEKREHGISINIEGPGGEWRDVSSFSGGEKTQINAALRFAIAEELASIVQFGVIKGRMKTLMIDEGDLGSLDTDISRYLFVTKLLDMSRYFEKVILITHLEEVAERFDNKIRVVMTPENESKITMDVE